MSIAAEFTAELDYELPATRHVLERIPNDKLQFKPHPRSSAFGHIAQWVARMPGVLAQIVRGIDLDLSRSPPYSFEPSEKLVHEFDSCVVELHKALKSASDADFARDWRILYDGQVGDTAVRKDALRNSINHLVHHRAQLAVYLRLNDVPVPQLYGPTADEK